MGTALLLIDIQNDYFKGGRHELPNADRCITGAEIALSLFRGKGLPVIFVRHINSRGDAACFLPDSEGSNIHRRLLPLENEKIIDKHFPDCFQNTVLHEYLKVKYINRLVICGMMSHMCVDSTVRSARRLWYDVILLDDACAADDLCWNYTQFSAETVHQTVMASLNGAFATVINTNRLRDILLT